MGLRRGDAFAPFVNVGRALLTTSSGLVPLPWLAFVGGVTLHVVLMLIVGGLFALLALRARGALLGGAAALYAALVAVAANALGSRTMGAFGVLPVSRVQSTFLMALFAVALFAGVVWSRARGQEHP
jgi:hypothetical protein